MSSLEVMVERCRSLLEAERCFALLLALLLTLGARSAWADAREFRPVMDAPGLDPRLTLPIEVGLGNARHDWRDGPLATYDLAFLPGIDLEHWQFNLSLRGLYQNPYCDFAVGGRMSYRIINLLDGVVPVRLAFDGSYVTVERGARLAGGVQAGLGKLLSLGLWAGRDSSVERTFINLALLFDTLKLGDPIGAILDLTPTQDLRRD